jgi:hypothetical protein
MLPDAVKPALARHPEFVKQQHEAELAPGAGRVELPWALGRKYPNAACSTAGPQTSEVRLTRCRFSDVQIHRRREPQTPRSGSYRSA